MMPPPKRGFVHVLSAKYFAYAACTDGFSWKPRSVKQSKICTVALPSVIEPPEEPYTGV